MAAAPAVTAAAAAVKADLLQTAPYEADTVARPLNKVAP